MIILPFVKGDDGCAASALPDPRGSLSAAIPAKTIIELISKCRRQLNTWLQLGRHGSCKYRPTLLSVIGKYVSQHGAAGVAGAVC